MYDRETRTRIESWIELLQRLATETREQLRGNVLRRRARDFSSQAAHLSRNIRKNMRRRGVAKLDGKVGLIELETPTRLGRQAGAGVEGDRPS